MAERHGTYLSTDPKLRNLADMPPVVVTLNPVYLPDSLPFRSLTFTSDNYTIPIGRSSKSQVKNLVPAHNNGWFDSRVMSRSHAVFSVSFDKKVC
jgi:hypothetical protein